MIDFSSGGIFAASLGQPVHPAIDAVLKNQSITAHYGGEKSARRYISMLKELTGYESVALFTTGAEATEAWWRCCRVYTGKSGVWGGLIDPDESGTDAPKCDAFHGWTLGAMIMSGRVTWLELGISPELGENRFGKVPEVTAGMIMEPYHAPSGQFHRIDPTINRVLLMQKEFPDIPLCVDEIQGGFGRTGKLFAHEWYKGMKPDFVTIGKAAGAGYPISALLGPKEIMESKTVKKYGHLHSTHSGHPLMCDIGCAVIKTMQKEELIDRSQLWGVWLKNRLDTCGIRHQAGRGLMAVLEFKNKTEAAKIARKCKKNGLWVVNTGRKWVKLGPPLNLPVQHLEEGAQILLDTIKEVLK